MSTGQMAVATTTTGSALIPSQLTISSPALFSGGPAAIHAVNIVDLFTAYLRPGDPASQEILPKRPSCQWVTGPLSPFLRKDAIVMGNLRTRKILKRDFEEAWARYVPLEPIPKGAGKVMAACSTIAWGGLAALGLGALGAVDLTYPQMIASKITYLIGLGGMTLDLLIPLSAFTFLRNRIWAEFIGNTHELEATQAKKNPDPDPSMLTVKEALAMAIAEGFPDLNLPDYVARRFDQQTLLQLKNLARGYMALAITPTLMSHPYESLGGTARANAFLREQEREIKDAGIEGGAILANIEGAIRAIGHEPLMFELEEVSRMDRIHRQIAEIGRAASDLRMPNTRANLKILYDHWELLSEIRSYPLLPSGIIKEKLDHLANKLERRIINLEWQIGVRIKAFDKVEYVFDLAAEGNEDFDSPVPYAAKLGSGGMSVVYRAHRAEGLKSVGDTVAIRILRFDKLLADGTLNMEVLTRKILEQFAMQRDRSHPGVMRVLNYGALPNDGPYYLITEYLDGITLEHTLLRMRSERQMTTPRKVLKIIREILAALEETQLIHRDLKPDNIFVVPTKGAPARHVISDLDLATRGDLQAGIALPDLVG
ncbi:MAG: protein kinase, partial [Deltaproteobacteria bacterium]|nr:protein kinase [Deltaproteobacteria bacterium]